MRKFILILFALTIILQVIGCKKETDPVKAFENGDYETYFKNMEFLYSCLNNRLPETARGIGAKDIVLAIYGTFNAVSEINVKYQNSSPYIFGKTSLNGFSKRVTKLLNSEKYENLKGYILSRILHLTEL